jgi:tellurite resistance protein TerC
MGYLMAAPPDHDLPPVSPLVWVCFGAFVAVILAIDLFVLNRKHEEPSLRKSTVQTLLFVSLAAAVGVAIFVLTDLGADGFGQFVAAYVTEWSLSVDNIFVIALVMTFFAVPREYQHKVLFWGILGALVMRLLFISVGVTAIQEFTFVLGVMGLFLIYTAWGVATSDDEDQDITKSRSYKLITRYIKTTKRFYGDRFFTKQEDGKLKATPLFLCVLVVEATDLVFAIDSIPAVLAITGSTFIAFSSNVMAIMGLRSVFFLFGHIQDKVTRLNEGLAIILAFVGVKMILAWDWGMEMVNHVTSLLNWHVHEYHIPTWFSLSFIVFVLIGSVIASLVWPKTGEVESFEIVETDQIMVELFIDTSDTMSGEWNDRLVDRYMRELMVSLSRYDSDGNLPVYGFADRVVSLGDFPIDDVDTLRRPNLGWNSDLAAMLRFAEDHAKRTTGKFIFVVMTDGRVLDERAAREVFVTMPSNAFILFVRVSDEPGGAEFLQSLDDYNVGDADRCDTIHATDDSGQPKEQIAEVIGREIDDWVGVNA